jgi:glycine/D-amino acid oxidase-like deaminating enzyme
VNRAAFLETIIARREPWDMAVIGGGATGAGIAVDAASRGYRVVLLEQSDFGKGTSSRSTKLVHGGVRYLQQGNIPLVMEALKERGLLLQNAPHLVRNLEFVVPNYLWWEAPFYGIGLKMYDLLAGQHGFGPSKILSRNEVLQHIPTLEPDGLRGGVIYHDGQFDDSRLLINLLQTAVEQGAWVLNYAQVTALVKDARGQVTGLTFREEESGREHALSARCLINATGPFCDQLRRLDNPASAPMIAPSQGVHLVLPREFLAGDAAIMVPHTRDGQIRLQHRGAVARPYHSGFPVRLADYCRRQMDDLPENGRRRSEPCRRSCFIAGASLRDERVACAWISKSARSARPARELRFGCCANRRSHPRTTRPGDAAARGTAHLRSTNRLGRASRNGAHVG